MDLTAKKQLHPIDSNAVKSKAKPRIIRSRSATTDRQKENQLALTHVPVKMQRNVNEALGASSKVNCLK